MSKNILMGNVMFLTKSEISRLKKELEHSTITFLATEKEINKQIKFLEYLEKQIEKEGEVSE